MQDERALFPQGGRHVDAAVLIALTDRASPGVILTQRPSTMRSHAGQVAFPGGKIDAEDAGPVAAALREAHEEVAMPPESVEIIGTSDLFLTGSGFAITPVLGVVPPDLDYQANPHEVESWFETPLEFLFDQQSWRRQSVMWEGHERHYWEAWWDGHRIWGVTAGIIRNLAWRLRGIIW